MRYPRDFHRQSIRLQGYDYSRPGGYFVTVCTMNKEQILGKVEGGRVILSPSGKIVSACWEEISDHYQNVDLDQWIIMPNHLHGIIIIHEHCRQNGMTDSPVCKPWVTMFLPNGQSHNQT